MAAAGAAGPLMRVADAAAWKGISKSANDKLVIGLVGCGGMGAANMRNLMNFPDVEVAAVCDVDDNRMLGKPTSPMSREKYGRKPAVYKDLPEDAGPEGHRDAASSSERPGSLARFGADPCVRGGGRMLIARSQLSSPYHRGGLNGGGCVKHHKLAVVQVRHLCSAATKEFTDAITDYIRTGKLGKIVLCRGRGSPMTFTVGTSSPRLFRPGWITTPGLGPAPFLPYQTNRCHLQLALVHELRRRG